MHSVHGHWKHIPQVTPFGGNDEIGFSKENVLHVFDNVYNERF